MWRNIFCRCVLIPVFKIFTTDCQLIITVAKYKFKKSNPYTELRLIAFTDYGHPMKA